jgi:hypothetical protein
MLAPDHVARHAEALLEGRHLAAATIRAGNLGRRAWAAAQAVAGRGARQPG